MAKSEWAKKRTEICIAEKCAEILNKLGTTRAKTLSAARDFGGITLPISKEDIEKHIKYAQRLIITQKVKKNDNRN